MKQWLLLDQFSKEISLKQIWKLSSPKMYYLFDDTSLSEYKEEGPLLFGGDIKALLADYQTNPTNWHGLIINSSQTEQELIKHLRALLFVTYPPESKGILSYYNIHTASYFSSNTEPAAIATWLGPINSLKWYGGTWQQQANEQLQWYEIENPATQATSSIAEFYPLTEQQQQALTLARQHKYAYDWAESYQQDFNQTYQHLQEAITLDFDEIQYLRQYLELRAKYPQQSIPELIEGTNAQQRLDYLNNTWRIKGRESYV